MIQIEMATEVGGRGEQLTSLVLRCAERLCVPFAAFYRELIVPSIYEGRPIPAICGIPVQGTVDGPLQAAEMWSKAMNVILDRTDLQRATLLPWRQTLAPRKLVRLHRAWCPVCLHEFACSGKTAYEPLVWRVSDVVVCPHHKVRLQSQCPHCGRGRQPSFRAFARVGCCRACGKWLGREIPEESALIGELDVFVASAVEDALSLSDTGVDIMPSDLAVRSLREVFYCGSSTQMGRALGVQPRQIGHFADGRYPAPLWLFVRASYATGATMEEIFVTNRFDTEHGARETPNFTIPDVIPRRLRLRADLVVRLKDAIADGGSLSVAAIAEALNITATTVWRRERELASCLAKMHAEFIATEEKARKEKYRAQVNEFIAACTARGVTPTRIEVDVECGGDGSISTYWKREIIKDVMARASLSARSNRQ